MIKDKFKIQKTNNNQKGVLMNVHIPLTINELEILNKVLIGFNTREITQKETYKGSALQTLTDKILKLNNKLNKQ